VPKNEWEIGTTAKVSQRKRLLDEMPYEEIVAHLEKEAIVVEHKRERARNSPLFFRAQVTLKVGASTVDRFHSSIGGYRAQFYDSVERGLRGNAYALARLVPLVLDRLDGLLKRTCPAEWFEQSLSDPAAKVWIHQGSWWRHAKTGDRHLRVSRWLEQQSSPDPDRRAKARWGALTPDEETRIDLKGAFLSLSGTPLGSLKPDRALNINQLGFT
jgi:hypothetical protein